MPSNNIEMLQKVAHGLGKLRDEVVFVGGSVAELYIENPDASEIRPTIDIDCVVELSSMMQYYSLEEELRKKKFNNDMTPGAPICRWIYEDIIVDIMPVNADILGFGNKWYQSGVSQKVIKQLPDNSKIYIFPIEYYLATKFEAVNGRGGNDLRLSHDFEDVIFIMNNHEDIVELINKQKDENLRIYLIEQCINLLYQANINEAIMCVLPFDSDHRVPIMNDLIKNISELS